MAFFRAPVDPNPSPTFSEAASVQKLLYSVALLGTRLRKGSANSCQLGDGPSPLGSLLSEREDSRSSASTPKLSSSSADSSRAYPGFVPRPGARDAFPCAEVLAKETCHLLQVLF